MAEQTNEMVGGPLSWASPHKRAEELARLAEELLRQLKEEREKGMPTEEHLNEEIKSAQALAVSDRMVSQFIIS